ncbi:MAG: hypothetical protein JSR80_07190 [Verrucomicrobia bacterium]|nr:hypothetical protein [Verrucomicrobiota bacterium]
MKGAIAGGATCATVSLLDAIRLGVAAKKTPPIPLSKDEALAQLTKTPEKLDLSNLKEDVDLSALVKELAANQKPEIKEIIYKEGATVEITLAAKEHPLLANVLKLAPKGAKITIQGKFSLTEMQAIPSDAKDKSLIIPFLVLKNTNIDEVQKLSITGIEKLIFKCYYDDTTQIPKIIHHLNPQKIVFKDVKERIEGITVGDWKEISNNYQLKYELLRRNEEKGKENKCETDMKAAKIALDKYSTEFDQLKDNDDPNAFSEVKTLLKGGKWCFTNNRMASWYLFLEKRGE